jgi:flagellar biosynthesis chaperone FliJ
MAAIDTLMRLARLEMERLAQALGQAEQDAAAALDRQADFTALVAHEQAAADADPELCGYYGSYAPRVRAEAEALAKARLAQEVLVEEARRTLQAAQQELRKLERLAEMRAERDARAARAREQSELDEAAVLRAARRLS